MPVARSIPWIRPPWSACFKVRHSWRSHHRVFQHLAPGDITSFLLFLAELSLLGEANRFTNQLSAPRGRASPILQMTHRPGTEGHNDKKNFAAARRCEVSHSASALAAGSGDSLEAPTTARQLRSTRSSSKACNRWLSKTHDGRPGQSQKSQRRQRVVERLKRAGYSSLPVEELVRLATMESLPSMSSA